MSPAPLAGLPAPFKVDGLVVTDDAGVWIMLRPDGSVATHTLRLHPDGTLSGHVGDDESGWLISNGDLCFTDRQGNIATRFSERLASSPTLRLRGRYRENPEILLTLERRDWQQREQLPMSSAARMQREIAAFGWDIGEHTYGAPHIIEPDSGHLAIGRFCSIAEGVSIALANHQSGFSSTYPFATLRSYWPSAPHDVADHISKGEVRIGNDVWIGANAFIGSGVTIHDGAVIGAHAVVVKDVPPYAVCVGNPGRVVKYRFEPEIITALLKLRWWDWPDEKIDRFLPLILSPDIVAFLNAAEATA